MLRLNRILTLLIFGISYGTVAEDVVHTKWRLKDSLLNVEKFKESQNNHQFKFGYSSKTLTGLKVKSASNLYSFGDQRVPGGKVGYNYTFDLLGTSSSIYATAGYFTRYNDLGAQGYADLSVFDFFSGFSVGYSFFESVKVTPSLFGGLGHSYYFQRGDAKAANADERIFEVEYGANLDFGITRRDAYPDSWSSEYIISFRYSFVTPISGSESLNSGEKLAVLFGVQL